MKRLLLATMLVLNGMGGAVAQYGQPLRMETTDQARQRHSAENYGTYRQNQNQVPLGGYSERLGDPSPVGTERPGYAPKGYDSNPYGASNDEQQRRNRNW